jgi:pyruvate-ferredoxin/flavodoxin oxidoreductase
MKVYEPRCWRAPRPLQSVRRPRTGMERAQVHDPGRAGGLHGLRLCVDICPAKNKSEAKLKAINMRPQAPLRVTGA